MTDRYHRQSILPQFGTAGQERLRAAHVLLLGVGALGSTIAEQLVRAGIGKLTLVDRDVVELTNLQRQALFDESDAKRGLPKVEAAARRLRALNAEVELLPKPLDVDASNIESLIEKDTTLLLDGSDNAELRYLINDVLIKRSLPWVMGACIGTEGRVASFDPRRKGSPCLRCLFPTPPSAGELATCDTVGVLGPAIGVVASLQVAGAMKFLVEPEPSLQLFTLDVWTGRFKTIDLAEARSPDCVCCGRRSLEFLNRASAGGTRLCGRNVVQVRPPLPTRIDLLKLAEKVRPIADIDATQLMLKLVLHEKPQHPISIFGDGRMLVFGTDDPALARGLYARVVGV
jgi:adenylyltransferase/sulfurtransferase